MVRVLPGQAANPSVAREITGFDGAHRHADAVAIAPYVSMILGPRSKPTAAEASAWTVDQILAHLERVALPRAIDGIERHAELASGLGLELIAYEGGQHMVGIGGGENLEPLTRLLISANSAPGLEPIYDRYLEAWSKAGGGLFCHFSSIGRWTKWGSWGLLQYLDDDVEASPMFRAVRKWA